MKKLIATIIMVITLAAILMLTACEAGKAISAAGQIAGVVKPLVDKHEHVIGAMPDVESTCMEHGLTGGMMCLTCGEVLVAPVKAPLAPHRYDGDDDSTCNWCNYERFCLHRNTQKIVGKIATCQEKGLTDGEICLDCNATITPQYEIPLAAHTEAVISAIESTCYSHGKTEGKYCTVCQKTLVAPQETPLKSHTYSNDSDLSCNVCSYVRSCTHEQLTTISAKAATCTQTGVTEGKKCSRCGEITLAQTIIPLAPHTEAALLGASATCTSIGLTEGKYCSVCNIIIVAQNIIPATGHTFGDWITVKNPTTTEEGMKERYCTTCGAKEIESIPVEKVSQGLEFTSNGDGTCYVSGIGTCTDTDIVVPAVSPSGDSVTSIGDSAFYDCNSLTSVVIPDSVTYIGWGAFYYCSSLTSVVIPDGVESIDRYAFSDCSSLTSVVIPDGVTSIGNGAFRNCSSLTEIKVDSNNANYKDIDGNLYTKDGKTLIQYAIGKSDTSFTISDSVTSIGYYTFSNCTSLTGVVIPNSVKSIGVGAFFNCTRLTSVVIPDSITSIGDYAFCNCSSLTSVVIPDSVTSIGDGAFYGCSSLTSIVIPDSVTSIGSYAFDSCSSLESVVIPDSVTSIGNDAFSWCTSLTSVVIPDSVTSIGSHAFYNCKSLTSIKYRSTQSQWNDISKESNWDEYYLNGAYHKINYTITYNYDGE